MILQVDGMSVQQSLWQGTMGAKHTG
jgi:hypothetical protein